MLGATARLLLNGKPASQTRQLVRWSYDAVVPRRAYHRGVATATVSSTPNPDALKFTLDTKLEAMFNASNTADAAGNAFATAVLAVDGVASVFGVNDFVTVTRQPGADWEPIIAVVHAAAGAHL